MDPSNYCYLGFVLSGGAALFGMSKRERFRRQFFEFLSVDVFGMSKSKLLSHYPGLRKACEADAGGQISAKESAVFAARAVIVDLISKISDARREKVHVEYSAIPWDDFYAWYLSSRIRPRSPPKDVDALTQFIVRAQCAVTREFNLGEIGELALDDFERDVAGALEGLSERERTMERIRSALDITTAKLGMDPRKFRPPT